MFQSEGKACPRGRTEIDSPLLSREKLGASRRNDVKIVPSLLNGGREVPSQLTRGWGLRQGALCNEHSSGRKQIRIQHKKTRAISQYQSHVNRPKKKKVFVIDHTVESSGKKEKFYLS